MPAEEPQEELDRLEADLTALVPRRDGFDPQWRAMLAKEAERTAVQASRVQCPAAECHHGRHRFVCLDCGCSPEAGRGGRWAWPAAFAAMSTVAASLLAMLVLRADSPLAHVDVAAPRPSANVRPVEPAAPVNQSGKPSDEPVQPPEDSAFPARPLATALAHLPSESEYLLYVMPLGRYRRLEHLPATDPALLDKAFAASLGSEEDAGVSGVAVAQGPVSSRELLDQLLNASSPGMPQDPSDPTGTSP